jgi:hypothetical protein
VSIDPTSPTVQRIGLLVNERREIRSRSLPGTGTRADEHDRLVAIDAEIDELWTNWRRDQLPWRPSPPAKRSTSRG